MDLLPSLLQLSLIAPAVFCGGILQGASGFGFVLLVLPLIVLAGLPLAHAVVVASVASGTSSLLGAWKLRQHTPWGEVTFATLLRCLTIPLGTWLLTEINGFPASRIKAIVGGFVLLSIILQISLRVEPKEKLSLFWGVLAFGLSGLIHGMIAMGGPPVVLWVTANSWNSFKSRAFLLTVFGIITPIQVASLFFGFGMPALSMTGLALLFFPFALVGIHLGVKLGNRLSKTQLKFLSYFVLVIISLRCFL